MQYTNAECPTCEGEGQIDQRDPDASRSNGPDYVPCPDCGEGIEQPESIPVVIPNWRCNGTIDPMIQDIDTLARVACDELGEAMLWIDAQLVGFRLREKVGDDWEGMAGLFFRHRETPAWERLDPKPPFTDHMRTVAQFIAKHGGISSRAQCRDFADAYAAIRNVAPYNEFDPQRFALELRSKRRLAYYEPRPFYGGDKLYNNPNSGTDFFTYDVAWEHSFAFYVSWVNTGYTPYAMRPGETTACRMTPEAFRRDMDAVAKSGNADEYEMFTERNKVSYRFWWD